MGTAVLLVSCAILTADNYYLMLHLVRSVILSLGVAGSFLAARRMLTRNAEKPFQSILKASAGAGILCALADAAAFEFLCTRGEYCMMKFMMPAVELVLLPLLFWGINCGFLWLQKRGHFPYVLIMLCILSFSVGGYAVTNWDSDCSRPGLEYGQSVCLVRKSVATGNYYLCDKISGGQSARADCFSALSRELDNPDICRIYLKDEYQDICLGHFTKQKP
jgi:hypothetical protein